MEQVNQIIRDFEIKFNTKVSEKINLINALVIKFENGISIDIPLKILIGGEFNLTYI